MATCDKNSKTSTNKILVTPGESIHINTHHRQSCRLAQLEELTKICKKIC